MRKIALLSLVILFFGTGCLWQGSRTGPAVGVVGDSISTRYFAGDEITSTLEAENYGWALRAKAGIRWDQEENWIAAMLERPADRMVINLGTNDALQISKGLWTREQSAAAIATKLEELSSVPCVYLTTVNTHVLVANYAPHAHWLNELYRHYAATMDNVELIDWDAFTGDYYASGAPYGPITTDTIHPNDFGSAYLALLTLDAVQECTA